MNNGTKSLMLAFVVSMLFLLLTVFSSSSTFNLLPYMLYESFSPGGADETSFIIGFDIAFSILVFYIAYKVANRVLARKHR
jgi:ABC-type spermidine/putrescine transport system permease subunit II